MHKKFSSRVFLIFSCVAQISCATAFTQPSNPGQALYTQSKRYKSCSLKVFQMEMWRSSELLNLFPMEKLKGFQEGVKDKLLSSETCDTVTVLEVRQENLYSKESVDGIKAALLSRQADQDEAEVKLEYFVFTGYRTLHGSGIFGFAYLMTHIVSLGLIPIWFPEGLELYVKKSEHGKSEIAHFHNGNSSWSWSPLRIWGAKKFDEAIPKNFEDLAQGLQNQSLNFVNR